MALKIVSNGILGDGTGLNQIDLTTINSALVENPSDYVNQANTYGAWLNTVFSLDVNNKLKATNAPTEFNRDSLLNVMQLIGGNLGTATDGVSILFMYETSTSRGVLDNYGYAIKYDVANTVNKIYPQAVDVVEGTPIAIN